MWAQILGNMVGALLGWTLAMYVIFYFLGFPPIHEVLDVLLRTIMLEKLL